MNGEKKRYFDFPTGSLVVIVAFVAMLIFNAIVSLMPLPDVASTWICVLGNQVVILAACLVASKVRGVSFLAFTGLKRPPKAYLFPFFILIAASCYAAFGPVAGMVSHLLSRAGCTTQPNYAIPWEKPGLFVLAFLALTLIPPIGEETLFRGVLISGAKRRFPFFAILYSALTFALFHGNPHQLVYQFFLGLTVSYLAVTTGSIYAGAVVHGFSNALAVLLSYFSYHDMIDKKFFNYFEGDGFYVTWEILVGVFASVLLLVGLVVLVTYLLRREREKEGEEYEISDDGIWKDANLFLSYLAFSRKERDEIAREREEQSGRAVRRDSFFDLYRIVLPVVLVVILALVVIFSAVLGAGE